MNTDEGKTDSGRRVRKRNAATGRFEMKKAAATGFEVKNAAAATGRFEVKLTNSGRKTERLTARLTADQDALIRYAAEIEGTDITNFTITTLLARALDILADRKLFIVEDAAWNQFLSMLDAPVSHKPQLEKLFSEPTIFDTRPKP